MEGRELILRLFNKEKRILIILCERKHKQAFGILFGSETHGKELKQYFVNNSVESITSEFRDYHHLLGQSRTPSSLELG